MSADADSELRHAINEVGSDGREEEAVEGCLASCLADVWENNFTIDSDGRTDERAIEVAMEAWMALIVIRHRFS